MMTLDALFLILALVLHGGGQAAPATATGTVSGRLLLASGGAASNVRIALSPVDESEKLVGLTQTNNEGRYRIENVPPGRYIVTAGLINFPTYLPGVSTRADATVLAITAGSAVMAPDFRLAANSGFHVRGQIVAKGLPQDRPPQPLEIQFVRSATGGARGARGAGGPITPEVRVRARVDPDGWFEFSSLPAGRYLAGPFRGPLDPMPPVIGVLQNIDVDRDISDLRLDFPESQWTARFDGTVKIDGLGPIPSASITLTSPPAAARRAALSKDTFYISPVPAGEYVVSVVDLPPTYTVKSIRAGSLDLTKEKLKATPINPPHIEVTLSVASPLPGVRVIGRMTNPENHRLPMGFQISGVTPGLTLSAEILPDGTFELPLVPPGRYNVSFINPVDSAERTITVGSQNPTRLDVPMQIPGLRKLWVTVAASPVPSVWVVLRPTGQAGGAEIRATRNADPKNAPSVPATGDIHFEFLNVKPGTYELVLVDQVAARGRGGSTLNPRAVPVVVGDEDILAIRLNAR
jgi:hypothetical protein